MADLLRGDYKQSDYGKVILPFTLLRRVDCVLDATKPAVLEEHQARKHLKMPLDAFLLRKANQTFYNTSELDFARLLADPANIKANLVGYIGGFSENARDIFERYDFQVQIEKLDSANLLYQVAAILILKIGVTKGPGCAKVRIFSERSKRCPSRSHWARS